MITRSGVGFIMLASLVLGFGCGPPQLSADEAKAILGERLDFVDLAVSGVRYEDARAVARVGIEGLVDPFEFDATFELFDTGWMLEDLKVEGASVSPREFMVAINMGLQRRTMASMRDFAIANGQYREASGHYAAKLVDLQPEFIREIQTADAWGRPWLYEATKAGGYYIMSLGSDGEEGPAPPANWPGFPYEPDLILVNGKFTHAPTGH